MRALFFLITFFVFFIDNVTGQIHDYVVDLSNENGVSRGDKFFHQITKNNTFEKNIFLLSDAYHYCEIEDLRKSLNISFIKNLNIDKIFVENSLVTKILINDFIENEVNYLDYKVPRKSNYFTDKLAHPDSTVFPYFDALIEEFDFIKSSNTLKYFQDIKSINAFDKFEFIDIGTSFPYADIFHLIKITKELNSLKDTVVIN